MKESIVSEKKKKLFDEINSQPYKIGDKVRVKRKFINSSRGDDFLYTCDITNIKGSEVWVKAPERSDSIKLDISQIEGKYLYTIGENPFVEKSRIQNINYALDSIVFSLNLIGDRNRDYHEDGILILESNFDPIVFDKNGNQQTYQRPLVWELEDNQLLVESIYNHIDCGKILIRNRSFKEIRNLVSRGVKNVAFRDVVDGKQRLNAIKMFLNNEFCDLKGNYYSDLSYNAQHMFLNNQLISYSELPENTSDDDVIYQFLKVNFAGKPQSIEHIEYVKELYKQLNNIDQ